MSDEHNHLKKITKGAMVVFIGMFIGRFFGYVTRIVMARFFGADAYGMFMLASAIVGIVTTMALLGIPQGLSRFISYYMGKNNLQKVKGTIFSAIKITFPLGIVGGVLVFLFSGEISVYFFNEPELMPLVQLFSLSIPLSVILAIILHIFRGFQKMRYKVIIEDSLKPVSTLLLVVIFFFLGYGIIGAVLAYTIGYIISVIIGAYLLIRFSPMLGKRIDSLSVKKDLFSFSWPLIISGYLWMVITWTDTMLLGFFWNSSDVGIYNAILTTAAVLLVVIDAFIYIFMPVISELYAKGKKREIFDVHRSLTKWIFMINISFFLLMVLFPDNVLGVLFGKDFFDQHIYAASTVLIILSTGNMIRIFGSLTTSGIMAIGKTKLITSITIIGAIVNLTVNLLLIPEFGIIGAAIGTTTAFIVMALIKFYFGYRYIGLQPISMSFIKAILSGAISVGLFYIIIKSFYSSPPWWVLAGTLPLFIIIYGILFLIMRGFDKSDVIILKTIEKKTGIHIGFLRKIIKKFI